MSDPIVSDVRFGTPTKPKVCPGCGRVGEYAGFCRDCPVCEALTTTAKEKP